MGLEKMVSHELWIQGGAPNAGSAGSPTLVAEKKQKVLGSASPCVGAFSFFRNVIQMKSLSSKAVLGD